MTAFAPPPTAPLAAPSDDAAEHQLGLPGRDFWVAGCRVEAEVASGGMAVLYRGVQESLGRPVAIKALRSDVLGAAAEPTAPDWPARFVREAQLLAKLQHQNLVHVYDLVDERPQGGSLFIIMELCIGLDLLDLLERRRQQAPPLGLGVEPVAVIGLQVARALAQIHAVGIVHRDLKPANLLLTTAGVMKLVDFGAAWDPENPRDVSGLESGLGTPSYMSPEQLRGQPIDPRSDQFSLGTVLHQLLTGRKPFGEQPAGSLLAQMLAGPPPLRLGDGPRAAALGQLVSRLLAPSPADRFADSEALVGELEALVGRLPQSRLLRSLLGPATVEAADHTLPPRPGPFPWLRSRLGGSR